MSNAQEIMLKSTALRPSEDRVESHCFTCARTATVSLWKTMFGGSLLERSTPAGGVRFVEKSPIGSNRTCFLSCKQEKELSGRKVQSACDTAGLLRKFDQCVEVAGESARGWRRSPTEHCDKPRQRKQERSHGRLAGLHQGGQSTRLGGWRATPRHGNFFKFGSQKLRKGGRMLQSRKVLMS